MERIDQRKITRNLFAVKRTLKGDIDSIAERLKEEGIFSKQITDEIADSEAQMKCGVFINKLLRSEPRAYQCFIDILEEFGFQKLVISMEKSRTLCSGVGSGWIEDREKTFILPPPQVPEIINRNVDDQIKTDSGHTDDVQLERMVTFIMNTVKDNTCRNKTDQPARELRNTVIEKPDPENSDELINFFKTLRCASIN